MPVNIYDKLVMGPDAGNQEGAIQKRWYKHVGELADKSKAKVVILYRTVPDESDNCLVVGTKFLSDQYHNALMKTVESAGGQSENELGPFLARQTFPDGTNMLAVLHSDNYIKKFATKDITVTYGPLAEGKIGLNKLNQMIAKEKGVKISELAIKDDATTAAAKTTEQTETTEKAKTTEKSNAQKTTKK